MDIELDMQKCKKEKDVFDLFARRLNFPEWWDYDWDGIVDCMTDPKFNNMGRDAHLVLINTGVLKQKDPKSFTMLTDVLDDVKELLNDESDKFSYEIRE